MEEEETGRKENKGGKKNTWRESNFTLFEKGENRKKERRETDLSWGAFWRIKLLYYTCAFSLKLIKIAFIMDKSVSSSLR